MWVNMYRLRVGQRLRELAVLTAVGAALNMGGAEEPAPAQATTASEISSELWAPTPAVDWTPEVAPQALPRPTHAWPRKHRSRADFEARLQKLEQIRREMEQAHLDLKTCIASSRDARAEGSNAAAAATMASSAAAAAYVQTSVGEAPKSSASIPAVSVVAVVVPSTSPAATGGRESVIVKRISCERRAPRVVRRASSEVRELAVYAMRP